MPGMLSEETQPSSGPASPPPAASPGAGAPPSGGASGSEHSAAPADVEAMKAQAIQLVYGERFDQLIEMFQTNGPDNFARSMAIAVNTAITEIEKSGTPVPPEAAAEVGGDLFAKLLEDMLVKPKDGMGAVVEGITGEQLQEVMPAILVMYSDSHPEVSKTDIQAVMAEIDSGVKAHNEANGTPSGDQPDANASPNVATASPNVATQGAPPGGQM